MPKQPSDLPDGQVTPNPALEKRTRRVFSTAYKVSANPTPSLPLLSG